MLFLTLVSFIEFRVCLYFYINTDAPNSSFCISHICRTLRLLIGFSSFQVFHVKFYLGKYESMSRQFLYKMFKAL